MVENKRSFVLSPSISNDTRCLNFTEISLSCVYFIPSWVGGGLGFPLSLHALKSSTIASIKTNNFFIKLIFCEKLNLCRLPRNCVMYQLTENGHELAQTI